MLVLKQVSKTFGTVAALRAIDLTVEPGRIHALIGHNGSGKSTLIKILAGFHDPDPGAEATFNGRELRLGDAHSARTAGLRFVHQDLGLVPSLGAVDNIALGAGYARRRTGAISWRRQARATEQALHRLGYELDVHTPLRELSPVECTAIAIARAMRDLDDVPDGGLQNLLVLDEPTATMPAPQVDRLLELVQRVRGLGAAVLYVSHHLGEIMTIADSVTVLRDGSRVATVAAAGTSERELATLMLGRAVTTATPSVGGTRTGPGKVILDRVGTSTLHELSLSVGEGEIVGVAGLVGSGRDDLCAAVFGADTRSGSVRVNGVEVAPGQPERATACGIGYVSADRRGEALVMDMSIRENLTLARLRDYRGFVRMRGSERSDVAAQMAELGVRARDGDQLVRDLSGGNQQKVAIGKWLARVPHVLLLDEPTQGVDIGGKADLHQLIRAAARSGTAVVVCSSDEDELEQLCHRVLVLRNGRIACELRGPQITAHRVALESLATTDVPSSPVEVCA